jgi:transcriptional regulator with XRE-family HTH domain
MPRMRSPHTAAYRLFRRRLVAARKEAGLTQDEVAKLLRWPQSRLSNVETGERRIDVIELAQLAKIYRRPLSYFVEV